MKISIIGAGNVGGKLGKLWAEKGHTIIYGVRNPLTPKVQTILQETGHSATAELVKNAVQKSDVAVLATPWEAVGEVVFQLVGLQGKILVDCTNPIHPNPDWPLAQESSAAEEIAKRLSGFKVVKAFNTIGAENFSDLTFGVLHADAFMCGDDAEAKKIVSQLAKDIGFDAVDVGNLRSAEMLESLAKLWLTLAHQQGIGSNIAFKLLHK
ncbi:MAG: NADPH-dependent F420 reductase [Bacteroidota bacterium]|nr:NADPH-dependent F420 reductase [Bacteroidota bacterium]